MPYRLRKKQAFLRFYVLRFAFLICVLLRFITFYVFVLCLYVLRLYSTVRFLPLQCVLPGTATPKKLCTFYKQVMHTK